MSPSELHRFYEDLVRKLRDRGVVCAITSGLACVHYGLAETTKDCDLLCHPDSFGPLLEILSETQLNGEHAHYRGHISPPLDAKWHRGGWTSHFEWPTRPDPMRLDIFGRAVRQSSPWEHDLQGLYAGMSVVAEMKRTDRDKDWPFITSLGTNMLRQRDSRGWLHIFDAAPLLELQEEFTIPADLLSRRPVLKLALNRDSKLQPALLAERLFWQELDRLRIRIYRAALRPYVLAIGRAGGSRPAGLREQHTLRMECAAKTLKPSPVAVYGLGRFIEEARGATAALIRSELLEWLPDVRPYFIFLEE